MTRSDSVKPIIGWREWVGLPVLGIPKIKAKVDTGARTSSLHAFDIHYAEQGVHTFVHFKVHPKQRDSHTMVAASAPLVEMRRVRASSGHATLRPVIRVQVELLGQSWPIEVTLISREAMGFRMLLGRQAMRGHFSIDPGRSFLGGRPARPKRKKKKKKKEEQR